MKTTKKEAWTSIEYEKHMECYISIDTVEKSHKGRFISIMHTVKQSS